MKKIDSHQHFWNYNPVRDSWIVDGMDVIKRDFSPTDILPLLLENDFAGCIAVQADQSEQETEYLLRLADEHDFIKAVVGWVDFRADNIVERLEYFSRFKKLKGFRHIVQSEAQPDFLLREDFCRGISHLERFGFTYDILIYPKHLKFALEFVRRFPRQTFILDHLAKPFIKDRLIDEWSADILEFKEYPNVSCKLAGLVTEADWNQWEAMDFQKYVDTVFDVFGTGRVMFGSDWPVCTLAASFTEVVDAVRQCTASISKEETDKLWGGNCSRIYRLD